MVKTRFAPSPTGFLHIGGARTCLFSWLYARRKGGKFVLRIEDTHQARCKKEYLEEILESLKWLGVDWDEIYYQSQRFELYRKYAQRLVEENKAYKKEGAIFFKYKFGKIEVDDLIRGKISFHQLPKDEEVIIKSDGSPTYNFSCVIDDALMEINYVIRGEDHISNTPKQILMYQALGFNLPCFAHLPLILSERGTRMSKRWGATALREYRKEGYLPQALANYLLLLGWSPKEDREIISLEEAKEVFEIKDVGKTASLFSWEKLNWLNSQYIKASSSHELTELARKILEEENFLPSHISNDYLDKVLELFKDRLVKLTDLKERARFCFYDDFSYSEETKDILQRNLSSQFKVLVERFSLIDDFTGEKIEKEFRQVAQSLGLKAKDLVHPARIALTGSKVGPGLFETMEVLGKERVISRLNRLIKYWQIN